MKTIKGFKVNGDRRRLKRLMYVGARNMRKDGGFCGREAFVAARSYSTKRGVA